MTINHSGSGLKKAGMTPAKAMIIPL